MSETEKILEIEPKDLPDDALILDVRTTEEHSDLALNQAHWHIPMNEIKPAEFIKNYHIGNKKLYLLCQRGNRSLYMAERFYEAGFKNVVNIKGGILRAKEQGLSLISHPHWHLKKKTDLIAGLLLLIGIIGGIFVSQTFFLIVILIAFLLILQSIIGKNIFKG